MIYTSVGFITVPVNMKFESPEELTKEEIVIIAEHLFSEAYKDKKIVKLNLQGAEETPINYLDVVFAEGEKVNEGNEVENSDETNDGG